MPVYNTKEEYLREAIESILNQTYTDFEFIIVNDGSTNNAEEVILSYQDQRIRYHKQENLGLSKTRNRLLELSEGEYLAFMDSDDISLPQRLEKQVNVLDHNPQVGVVGGWLEQFQGKSDIWKYIEKPRILDFYFYGNQFAQPLAMIRKSFLQKYGLRYNEDYPPAEDYELWSRAVRYMEFYNIPEVLLKYRWHESNISQTKEKEQKALAQKVQNNILSYVCSDTNARRILEYAYIKISQHQTIWQKIFSVRNIRFNQQKHKIITVFGFSFIWRK